MGAAARMPAVLAPSSMDPAGLPRVTPIPAALDASADRPQTGDVPNVFNDKGGTRFSGLDQINWIDNFMRTFLLGIVLMTALVINGLLARRKQVQ